MRELNAFGLPARIVPSGQVQVARVVQVARSTFALARLHKKCRLVQLHFDEGAVVEACAVEISPRHLEQIVLNLIINAADATANQGTITVTLRRDGEMVDLAVEDNGEGIPKALENRLFEPFFTTKAEGVGSGLGLAVSRRLAQACGGTLQLAATSEVGSRFVLRLPIASEFT